VNGGNFFHKQTVASTPPKVRGTYGEHRAPAYNGGLGSEPPAGSRVRAPGQGVRGAKPPWSWKLYNFWTSNWSDNFHAFHYILQTQCA